VKVSGNEEAFYGQEYVKRKALETKRNESGELKEQAAAQLGAKNYGKETKARECYEAGTLPPAHIHARAKRWVVKLFLSHLHTAMFFVEYGRLPPRRTRLAHLGHAHYIGAAECRTEVPGLIEALRATYPGICSEP
jgi:hypothetical protein